MALKILLAEDEVSLSRVYTAALEHQGYEVVAVANGQEAVDRGCKEAFDVFILDIMMPVKTGLEALAELRSAGNTSHILMLTAMSQLEDKITGLDSGADDYLTKPISLKELLARLASLERRLGVFTENILTVGSVTLNVAQQELTVTNAVRLAGKEAKLMEYLMLNKGKDLSTQEIFNHIWARDADPEMDEGYVYIYISYLRQKLKALHADIAILGEKDGEYRLVEVGHEDAD